MLRKQLLEIRITPELRNKINSVLDELWGGLMQRMLERIQAEDGLSEAFFAASRFAEEKNLEYVVIRLNNRLFFVSRETYDDGLPVFRASPNRADEAVYTEAIQAQAQALMLPPYLEDFWITEYENSEDLSPREQAELEAAQTQRRLRRGDPQPVITTTPLPPPTAQAPAAQAPEPAPAAQAPGAGSALERFAASGKGGLSNDPDEVEAIEELQTFLVELGLNVGNNGVDGKYGPRTIAAVRSFQENITMLAQDGDAGPDTIAAIQEVKTDVARIAELVAALNELTDSAVSIAYKSGLAKLLERDLTASERTELERLLSKYENFREAFPEYQTMAFSSAEAAISGEPLATAPEGPYTQGMVITDEVNDSLEAIGRERGMNGERLTPEDIEALNNAVANGDINPPSFASGAGDGAIAQNTAADAAAETPPPADAAAEPAQTVTYGNDVTNNIIMYLTQTDRQLEATQQFLATIQIENRPERELREIRSLLRNLVLPLMQGRRMFRVQGQSVTTEGGARTDSAQAIQDFIRGALTDAIQRASSQPQQDNQLGSFSQPIRRKARELFDLIDGITLPFQNNQIIDLFLSIENAEEYNQINRAFTILSSGTSLLDAADGEYLLPMGRIKGHLTSIGVTQPQTESQQIQDILKLLKDTI